MSHLKVCSCFSFSTVLTRVGLPSDDGPDCFPRTLLWDSLSVSESMNTKNERRRRKKNDFWCIRSKKRKEKHLFWGWKYFFLLTFFLFLLWRRQYLFRVRFYQINICQRVGSVQNEILSSKIKEREKSQIKIMSCLILNRLFWLK